MRIHTILASWVVALVTVLAFSSPVFAQASLLSSTTLNGAISATQTTLVLTSASASTGSTFGAPAAGQCLWVDQELMRITAMSSTTATVTRDRTRAQPHATSAVVLTGSCTQGGFKTSDPSTGLSGNQTCSAQPLPWVNVQTGVVYWCDQVTNKWVATNALAAYTYNSVRVAQ